MDQNSFNWVSGSYCFACGMLKPAKWMEASVRRKLAKDMFRSHGMVFHAPMVLEQVVVLRVAHVTVEVDEHQVQRVHPEGTVHVQELDAVRLLVQCIDQLQQVPPAMFGLQVLQG